MKKRLFLLFFVGLGMCASAFAHHSFAMFDADQVASRKGVVREFQWTNPHSWVQLMVTNDKGEVEEWSLEALSPNILGRMGWKRNSIKAGEQVTAYFNPLRNGAHGGNLVRVVKADGTIVGNPPK